MRKSKTRRKAIVIALAVIAVAVAVPAAAHIWSKPNNDPLSATLREYGFVPIKPASNLMSLGSLYYVDADVKDFKAICHPEKVDLAGVVIASRSWQMQENLERNGRFSTDVKIDLGWVLGGNADNNYTQRVQYSLTDIVLEEIPLGAAWLIFAKLMEKPECSRVAMQYIRAGGYVCQGQKTMQATAEFKLDSDTQRKLATAGKASADDIKGIVKLAVEAQGNQSVVERDGRLLAGAALKYGVSMNPICLAPLDARFERTLPQSTFGRVVNFVLFNIIEPILPAKASEPETAQRAPAVQG